MTRSLPASPRVPILAWLLAFALLALFPSSVAPVHAEVQPPKKGVLIEIPARFTVPAAPSRVWRVLTTTEGFATLTGFEIASADRARSFARTGDHVSARAWTDAGRLVVTHYAPNRELRVAWEPQNATYLCAKRIVLHTSGAATDVEYLDRYTDDQPRPDATAARVAAETKEHIAAFVALASK